MNALEAKLHRLILADGPISVALYMALCLGDAEHGYYMRQQAFGAGGDFTTAPEVSQLFGEMIGVFLALHLDQFHPDQPVTLVEMGPGRGTMMADVLRTLKQLRPAHFKLLDVAMVETSPRLRHLQEFAVQAYKTPVFYNSIAALPDHTPLLIMANEFLDALPTRQFIKSGTLWRERMVTVENGKLAFALGAPTLAPDEVPDAPELPADGAVLEIAPARSAVVADLAHRLIRQNGIGLLIDYGHLKSGFGDTLQAMRKHQFAPVLDAPGQADLTSHVDFEPLQKVARLAGCNVETCTQGQFLLDLGLLQRAGALGAGKSLEFQLQIQMAVERLAGPDAMGQLFKVMTLGPNPGPLFPVKT